jgi:hypothetical protein
MIASLIRRTFKLVISFSIATSLHVARAQIPGENVNVVTGNVFPGGDPFLQRQNEPSIAVSSANPQHLLAGANDYRTVDLPDPGTPGMTGDAWLGLYKSLDGGQTWRSTLVPGYRQDTLTCPTASTAAPAAAVAKTTCARKRGQLEGKLAQRAAVAAAAKGLAASADKCEDGEAPPPAVNPACGMEAGADPVVRAGTDGLLYYTGLLFQRDHSRSKIVLARFLDTNDRENGDATQATDPIRHVDTVEVAAGNADAEGTGLFVDKPWMAVDVPRGGAETCTIAVPGGPARSFPAGAIYVGYSVITQVKNVDVSSDIVIRRSLDCGASWDAPVKLNGPTSTKNMGVVLAVDPVTGKVYAVWRRIASGTESDAILVARTFSRGTRFTAARVIASIPPGRIFDHGYTSTSAFRSRSIPTLAISTPPTGSSRYLHVAWGQRDESGFSRILMSTAKVSPPPASSNEADEDDASADHWGEPLAADDVPLTDLRVNFTRGHQFMPQLTASQGRIVLVYYDSRFDHAQGLFAPNADGSGRFAPDSLGNFYTETKAPRTGPAADGSTQLFDDPAAIFNRWVDDWGDPDTYGAADPAAAKRLLYSRHTVDVRVAMATASATPVFAATQLSRYPVGFRGDEALRVDANGTWQLPGFAPDPASPDGTAMYVGAGPVVVDGFRLKLLRQLQANPPNLPIFKGGTAAFLGDYIDVTGPAFVRKGEHWQFNTDGTSSPVFHAIWTSNQDVRPPAPRPPIEGEPGYPDPTPRVNWKDYTPIKVDCVTDASGGTTCSSKFREGTTAPQCVPGQEGSRNQNVYASRITEGLLVSTPQNAKPLAADKVRTFVVFAQNATGREKAVRFALTPNDGVLASFQARPGELAAVVTVDAVVPARSHVFRTVFAKLGDPLASPTSSIEVRVDELAVGSACSAGDGTCAILPGGAAGFVTLNPPGSPALLRTPDGGTVNVSDEELFDPLLVDVSLGEANLHIEDPGNANLHIEDIAGTGLSNADPGNANLHIYDPTNANLHIDTLDGANLHIADLDNANLHIDGIDAANLHIDGIGAANLHIEGLASANLHIENLGDGPVSDLTHWVRNAGNTTVGYDVRVVGEQPVDDAGNAIPLQLMVTKVYTTPTAFNCELRERVHTQVEVNVPNVTPGILSPDASIAATDLDPSATHATMVLAPGQVAQVTLRGAVSLARMASIGQAVSVVPLPQGAPLSIVSDPSTCPQTGCTMREAVAVRRASVTALERALVRNDPPAWGLRASISDPAGLGTPTGLVTFVLEDATGQRQLAVAPIVEGTARLVYDPPAGASVFAYYAGDAVFAPSDARWSANAPPPTWTRRFVWQTQGTIEAGNTVAVANDGSLYFGGVGWFGPEITRLDLIGGTGLWTSVLGGSPASSVTDAALGASGDVYVVAEDRDVTTGIVRPFLARIGIDGALRWRENVVVIDGAAHALAVDEAHPCAPGEPQGCIWVVGGTKLHQAGAKLPTLWGFDLNGQQRLQRAPDPLVGYVQPDGLLAAGDVTLDGLGNVYVVAEGGNAYAAVLHLIRYYPDLGAAQVRRFELNDVVLDEGVAFAPGRIYVAASTASGGFLASVDINSFADVWTTGGAQFPQLERVAARDGLLVAAGRQGDGGLVLRADPATGAIVWTMPFDGTLHVNDVALGAGGGVFAVGTIPGTPSQGFVAKLAPDTGAELP